MHKPIQKGLFITSQKGKGCCFEKKGYAKVIKIKIGKKIGHKIHTTAITD